MTKNIYQLYPFVRDTGYQAGAYVAPASMYLVRSVLAEGEPIFAPALCHLQELYSGAYARPTLSTFDPSGPAYGVE